MKDWFAHFNQNLFDSISTNWYQNTNKPNIVLQILAKLYVLILKIRGFCYQKQWLKSHKPPCLVIIVGNITIGGTGKTPMVIWLVQQLIKWGYKPGVVSRGYGGNNYAEVKLVNKNSHPLEVGEEPILIAKHTNAPTVVGRDRYQAAELLYNQYKVDVIVADDGLQHLGLARDIEIVMVSGQRKYGNSYCLPAGPLREPLNRLSTVDFIVVKEGSKHDEYVMHLNAKKICAINNLNGTSPNEISINEFSNKTVHAVAGIGNPDDFFNALSQLGINFLKHSFPDHHVYSAEDIHFIDQEPIITTEKDAIKLKKFNVPNLYYLEAKVEVSDNFQQDIKQKITTAIKK